MYIKKSFIGLFLFCGFILQAQETYRITYEKINHNRKVEENDPIQVLADQNASIIGTVQSLANTIKKPTEFTYYNHQYPERLTQIFQRDPLVILHTTDSVKWNKVTFVKKNETKKILGLRVKKAVAIVNSNTLDIWYVDNLGINAAPSSIGIPLGFVVEFTRNQNTTIRASKIERIGVSINDLPLLSKIAKQPAVDNLTYRDLLWKSKFTAIELLNQHQINFANNRTSSDSILSLGNGTIVVRKIKLPKIASGSQVFLSIVQNSNGDAYDRTGTAFLIPKANSAEFLKAMKEGPKELPSYQNGNGKTYQGMAATENFNPLIELVRFFTPFGIKHFNHIQQKEMIWEEKANYRQDISEFTNLLSDQEVYIGFYIGNYDQGGHQLSAELTIHANPTQLLGGKKVLSLFNTSNPLEMVGQEYGSMFNSSKGMLVEFELKENWNNAKLRLITTGHGGWSNGDEFLPKENKVYLDNQQVFSIIPWRQDCGSYRAYNPASGNFDNGLSSSDYSRSNWCPGTITNPYFIQLGDLKAGKHQIQLKIPQGEPEAGSFSYWSVSGILLAD